MAQQKNLYTKRLISGFSVVILIIFFCLFISVSYFINSRHPHSKNLFIELKPEPVKNSDYPVYRVLEIEKLPFIVQARVKLENPGKNLFGPNIEDLVFKATFIDKDVVRVRITDKYKIQWDVNEYTYASMYSQNEYELVVNSYPFGFQVKDRSSELVVFNSIGMDFYFSERYLEIATELDSQSYRIGIGERKGKFQLFNGNYSIWPWKENQGHHPLFIQIHNRSTSGIYLHNFNAMEINLNKDSLKFKTTGGVLDFFIFIGKTTEEVIRNFHQITGLPSLPNFSDLGYHYGQPIENMQELSSLLAFFSKNQLQIDRLWLRNLTKYTRSFEVLPEYKDLYSKLAKYNISLVPELSSEITENSEFHSFETNTYLPYTSQGPKGRSSYIDWFAQRSGEHWVQALESFQSTLNFSGLSLVNNEVFIEETTPSSSSSSSSQLKLLFKPVNICLECNTIPLDTVHNNSFTEVDLHSLWGHMQVKATEDLFLKSNKRTSIFSESTRTGSRAFHILDSVHANWDLFKESIDSVLSFEVFGIRSGSNICAEKTSGKLELCLKWHQVSLFSPIMVNFKEEKLEASNIFDASIISGIREVVSTRYSLSLYIYSLFFEASLHGGTIVKPMIFEFTDQECLNYPYQLMLGSSILGIFSVTEKSSYVQAYLPKAFWYDLKTGKKVKAPNTNTEVFESFTLLIKGGSVVPIIEKSVLRINQVREENITVIAALDSSLSAYGAFYIDDGESADTLTTKKFTKVVVRAEKRSENIVIQVSNVLGGFLDAFKFIDKLRLFGCPSVQHIKLAGKNATFAYNQSFLDISIGLSTFHKTEVTITLTT